MERKTLISLTAIFIAATAAGNVNAQEAPPQKITVGPALELSGGTAFGIQGKIPISSSFSVRPIVLFGYRTNVNVPVTITSSSSSGGLSPGLAANAAVAGFSIGNSLVNQALFGSSFFP
jgi:hypothetical protein